MTGSPKDRESVGAGIQLRNVSHHQYVPIRLYSNPALQIRARDGKSVEWDSEHDLAGSDSDNGNCRTAVVQHRCWRSFTGGKLQALVDIDHTETTCGRAGFLPVFSEDTVTI
jgi:hypothetical protein